MMDADNCLSDRAYVYIPVILLIEFCILPPKRFIHPWSLAHRRPVWIERVRYEWWSWCCLELCYTATKNNEKKIFFRKWVTRVAGMFVFGFDRRQSRAAGPDTATWPHLGLYV